MKSTGPVKVLWGDRPTINVGTLIDGDFEFLGFRSAAYAFSRIDGDSPNPTKMESDRMVPV